MTGRDGHFKPFEGAECGLAPFLLGFDESFAVFFKPAGMHSVPAGKAGNGDRPAGSDTLLEWARVHFGELLSEGAVPGKGSGRTESGMCSRLDFETSGLVLFARDDAAFGRYRVSQRSGAVRKRYLLAACGGGQGLEGSRPVLTSPRMLGETILIESRFRSFGPKGARVACIDPALTETVKSRMAPGIYSTRLRPWRGPVPEMQNAEFLEATIPAGFRHQIRAHLAWIGKPIAGDSLYGSGGASRLFLEAHRIELIDRGKSIAFELYPEFASEPEVSNEE